MDKATHIAPPFGDMQGTGRKDACSQHKQTHQWCHRRCSCFLLSSGGGSGVDREQALASGNLHRVDGWRTVALQEGRPIRGGGGCRAEKPMAELVHETVAAGSLPIHYVSTIRCESQA